MSDPLESVGPGTVSPFLKSAGTVNAALEVLRRARGNLRGPTGAAGAPIDLLSPQTLVWVKNATGATLPARSVVALGEPVFDWTSDEIVHEARRNPYFPGSAPTASTDAFAVLVEPCGATRSLHNPSPLMARAAVLGVVPVDLNVTDSSHTHAAPAAGVTATLASATSGPAKIIWKESGTGTKRAAVLLTGQGAAAAGDASTTIIASATTITADDTFTDITGLTITLPSAGTYHVWVNLVGAGSVSAVVGGVANLMATVTDSSNTDVGGSAGSARFLLGMIPITNTSIGVTASWGRIVTATGSMTVKVRGARSAGPTWNQATIGGFDGSRIMRSCIGYIRL